MKNALVCEGLTHFLRSIFLHLVWLPYILNCVGKHLCYVVGDRRPAVLICFNFPLLSRPNRTVVTVLQPTALFSGSETGANPGQGCLCQHRRLLDLDLSGAGQAWASHQLAQGQSRIAQGMGFSIAPADWQMKQNKKNVNNDTTNNRMRSYDPCGRRLNKDGDHI